MKEKTKQTRTKTHVHSATQKFPEKNTAGNPRIKAAENCPQCTSSIKHADWYVYFRGQRELAHIQQTAASPPKHNPDRGLVWMKTHAFCKAAAPATYTDTQSKNTLIKSRTHLYAGLKHTHSPHCSYTYKSAI